MVREIWETEVGYVHDLEVVQKIFINPLRDASILSRTEIPQIFGNLEVLHQYNAQFLSSLNDRLSDSHNYEDINDLSLANIGDLFIQVATPNFSSMYKTYCKNYRACLDALRYFKDRIPEFDPFVRKCELAEECKALDLGSFLIKPVQRICKYPLLLRELLKCTSENHSDHEDLVKAIAIFEELTAHIDNAKEDTENFPDLERIQEKLDGFQVLTPGRVFIREGYLMKLSPRKADYYQERYLFLFNDVLVYARPKKNLKFQKGKRFEYRGAIPLSICLVRDLEGSQVEEEAAGVRQSRLHGKKKSLSKRDVNELFGSDSSAIKRKGINSGRMEPSSLDTSSSITRKRHAFSIVRMDTKKTYVMHAKSPEDKHLWLSAIEQVINELLEKKFVGEKPMTGAPSPASMLMMSAGAVLLDNPPAEMIKREVAFSSSLPAASALTAALASPAAHPSDDSASPAYVPTPRSNEAAAVSPPPSQSGAASPTTLASPPSSSGTPVYGTPSSTSTMATGNPLALSGNTNPTAALMASMGASTAAQPPMNKGEVMESLRRQNNRLKIVNEELEGRLQFAEHELRREREEAQAEIADLQRQRRELEALVDFLVQVTGKTRDELNEIRQWALEEVEDSSDEAEPDDEGREREEPEATVVEAVAEAEADMEAEAVATPKNESDGGEDAQQTKNEESDVVEAEKTEEQQGGVPSGESEGINEKNESETESESESESDNASDSANENIVEEPPQRAVDDEKLAVREIAAPELQATAEAQQQLLQLQRARDEEEARKTSLGRKWEEQARRVQMERELKNREWSDKKLDLIKIRHPSVRIAVPLEEIKKRFAQEELEKEIEKYFPRHLLQPGKPSASSTSPRSPRSEATAAAVSTASPTLSTPAVEGDNSEKKEERTLAPATAIVEAEEAGARPSEKGGGMVGYVSKLKKSNNDCRPGTFGFNAIPVVVGERESNGGTATAATLKGSNSFRLGSYRRERDSGSGAVGVDSDKRQLSTIGELKAADDVRSSTTTTSAPTVIAAQLDFIREEFGGGAGAKSESVDEYGVVSDAAAEVETNEAELQRMELRYRLQADREVANGKYARRVGVLYKKERNGDKWFGCKFVLGKYSLKYFKIRADWETAEALGEISLVRARVDCCPHGKDKGFCFLLQSPLETAFLAADKEDALRDWLEAIMGCIRDLPVGLRWSFRRDDSLVKAQSDLMLKERMEKREWLMNERQRTGSIPMPPTAAALATPGATTGEPSAASEQPTNDQQRKEGYAYVSTPSDSEGDSGKLLYCVCCRNGTLSTYASSKALTTPVAEYELAGRKLQARASAKDYAFTLRVSHEAEEQEEAQEVVTLRFLNEAELRAWHRFALSVAAAPTTTTNP